MPDLRLESDPVRTFDEVRAAIDGELGHGDGLGPTDAWERLAGATRVGWLLCETMGYLRGGRHHIWIQSYAQGDFDGPRPRGGLAWAGRELDPESADLLRWTCQRAAAVRRGERGEALFSVVNAVWGTRIGAGIEWMKALIERWPDGVDAGSLPEAPPFERPAPAKARPALPFTELVDLAHRGGVDLVVDGVSHHLYEAGIPEDALDDFYARIGGDAAGLLSRLAEWFEIPGADDRGGELALILDPLPGLLGLESIPIPSLLERPAADLEALLTAVQPHAAARLVQPTADLDTVSALRTAMRMDIDLILVRDADLHGPARALVEAAAQTGVIVVVGVA